MESLRNLAIGSLFAAICLTPAVRADARRMLSGQPVQPMFGISAGPNSDAGMAAGAIVPHLIARVFAELRAEIAR